MQGLKFDELVMNTCKELKPRGRMPILEVGFVFPLTLELLMRGHDYPEILGKLAVKKKEVSIHTLKRFHKKYSKEIDPIRKVGLLLREGKMKPTEILFVQYPGGEMTVTPESQWKEPIPSDFEAPFIMYARMNSTLKPSSMPKTIRELIQKHQTGEIEDLTARYGKGGAKQEKEDLLSVRLRQGRTGTRR